MTSSARLALPVPLVLLMAMVWGPASWSAWNADPDDKRQVSAARAIAAIQARRPDSEIFFEQAHAIAVFPSVTRIGFGFGGAYGKGLVIEGDRLIGSAGFWQFTSGIQAGARNFSMAIVFRDQTAFDDFKAGKAQFLGQAGLAIANKGIAGTPAYNDGTAIFVVTRLALMGEFTISGAKFSYKPISGSDD